MKPSWPVSKALEVPSVPCCKQIQGMIRADVEFEPRPQGQIEFDIYSFIHLINKYLSNINHGPDTIQDEPNTCVITIQQVMEIGRVGSRRTP